MRQPSTPIPDGIQPEKRAPSVRHNSPHKAVTNPPRERFNKVEVCEGIPDTDNVQSGYSLVRRGRA